MQQRRNVEEEIIIYISSSENENEEERSSFKNISLEEKPDMEMDKKQSKNDDMKRR